MPDRLMETTRLDVQTSDGRRVAVWRSHANSAGGGPVVVLSPGFSQRMRHVGAIALYLAHNGATVYRYDPLDHVGLSDGTIRQFTMSAALRSLQAVVDLAVDENGGAPVIAAAVSLLGRIAIRQAATDLRIRRLILLAGVIDIRTTLQNALGADYLGLRRSELPETLYFERHNLATLPFYDDAHRHEWVSEESTFRELTHIGNPVIAIHPSDDRWADIRSVRRMFSAETNYGPRYLVELPYGEHSLDKNPIALRTVLTKLTRVVMSPDPGDSDGMPVEIPRFESLLELAVAERDREREEVGEELVA